MNADVTPQSPRSRAVHPKGLLGMLAAVVVIELLVARHRLDLTPIVGTDWNQVGRRVAQESNGNDVLCFGDSLMRHGVLPRVVEERTGRRCLSLAVAAGQAPIDYFLLRRALDSGARPSTILVDFKPNLLEVDHVSNVWLYQQLLSVRESWELARVAESEDLFSRIVLGRFLPSIRNRTDLRDQLLAALAGRSASKREGNRYHLHHWRANRGSQLAAPNPRFQAADVDRAEFQALFKTPWSPSPLMTTYVQRFLQLAAQHDIQVFWLMPPLCPEARTRREQSGLEAAYTAFAQSIQAQFPNLIVLDGRRADYPRSVFVDPSHLDAVGGATLSADLGDLLRRPSRTDVPASRWIELSPYRALDDHDPALIAVKTQVGGRRR